MLVLSRIRVQLEAKVARDMLRNINQHLQQRVEESVKALEQVQIQLLQSEKMAAMGQLAAGVAHEINNPTAFVSTNLNTLQGYLNNMYSLIEAYERARAESGLSANASSPFDAVDQLRLRIDYDFLKQDGIALLAESADGIARVSKIVSDLKDFSRVGDTQWEWADLHHGLDSTLNIVWNELKYKCTVSKNYGQLPQVYCLPSQLNQVFMNLLMNAAQAIETKGDVEISTELVDDQAVRINIRDTGKGIAPENLNRIFEPFFTTKPVGKGTGLGLSLSWGIIERHHGKIEVSSTVGKGTSFSITLPIKPAVQEKGVDTSL
jgi:two-component system, NtrC family, sensor kinase